ncbi:MAG: arsenite methyltransferase [Anaerolineae bacterium]|nr:arsenite methyltransferase [Anaerolineae bacterium]
MTTKQNADEIRQSVRERYKDVARSCGGGCCEATSSCCCGTSALAATNAEQLGYSPEEISSIPAAANMGLGCGNPQAIAAIKLGEVVLDLGSGGGLDCFLAAQQVGIEGHVIGVDMTPEMISKARVNIDMASTQNVEFRLGEIERLPVADASVDVILSNCVINLSPDKEQVFREAYRVLKPGGRLAISDVVATALIPDSLRQDEDLWGGCVSGAQEIGKLEQTLIALGFQEVRITPKAESREFIREWVPGKSIEEYVVSATIEAMKPR